MDILPSKSKPRVRSELPASAILSSRELKQYRRWQRLYTTLKPTEQGFIPTAFEFDEFQQWFKKQDSGYFSDVFDDISNHIKPLHSSSTKSFAGFPIAPICGHTVHPVAADYSCLRCPICTIDIHLNYMTLLTRVFHNTNGRPLPQTGTPSKTQEDVYYAWSQEKISTLRQVSALEALAVEESEWSLKHPEVQFSDMNTASKALDLYWSEIGGCHTTERSKTQKTVAFADDTDFSPGRPVQDFLRNSPRYEPGKYFVMQEEVEEDHDISEDSEDYTHGNNHVTGVPNETNGLRDGVMLGEEKQAEALCSEDEDDGDSDWEDVESEEDYEESEDEGYTCFDTADDASFVVFEIP